MNVSIDRIEDGIVVLVTPDDPPGHIYLPAALLPPGCMEGDILTLTLEKDIAAARAARERVSGLIKKLKNRR